MFVNAARLEIVETLIRQRRAVRHFRPDPLPDGLLERLIDSARWAPSGYNLQPVHYVVVRDAELRRRLRAACLDQPQVTEAPAVVVFAADGRAHTRNFEPMVAAERVAGYISPEYETKLRTFVPLAFERGPLGLGWLWKAALAPLLRLARPIPEFPAVHRRHWLAKQTALAAMCFMLAAEAADLATVPMEGFDESRVRALLNIPRWVSVPILIPVGFAAERPAGKTRLPLAGALHIDRW